MPPLRGLLLRFRGQVGHPCLVTCHDLAQEPITLLTVSREKGQRTGSPLLFVFLGQHLGHPACICHNFVENSSRNLLEMQGQRLNGEPPIFTKFSFDRAHQIITDQKRPPAPRLVKHVISTFVKLSNPFPHHSFTHGIFTYTSRI